MQHLLSFRLMCALMAAIWGFWPHSVARATLASVPLAPSPSALCGGDPACLRGRWMPADLASLRALAPELGGALDTLAPGPAWVRYDLGALSRPLGRAELGREGPDSVAFRLLASELGPLRLQHGAEGLREAVAVLQVVQNRLAHGRTAARPYPGCGPEDSFVRCASSEEFVGMGRPAALRPAQGLSPQGLQALADRAMLAWVLVQRGLPDQTGGATEFLHRCGGKAYGQPTTACDEPSEWAQGADPLRGPLVLRAPTGRGATRRTTATLDWVGR